MFSCMINREIGYRRTVPLVTIYERRESMSSEKILGVQKLGFQMENRKSVYCDDAS